MYSGYFDNYKGQEPWPKCSRCGCSRPSQALMEVDKTFTCKDETTCKRMMEKPHERRVDS